MAVATPIAGAVPITQFTPAQQATLRSGAAVGNFQVINGHVMDTATAAGKALLAQRTANAPTAPAAPDPSAPVTPGAPGGGVGRIPFTGPHGAPNILGNLPPADPAADAAKIAKDAANRDALAQIKQVLQQYGLESLSDFAWQEIVAGRSGNEVLQDIRQTPQFQQRFPAIAARQKVGLPPLSPGDYVAYENTATQYMRNAGLPTGFYDSPEDFTKFLSGDVSLKELGERITLARDAANGPSEARDALVNKFGLSIGDLTAFFLDPDRAEPLLQRNYNAAQIAGAGTRTGYGDTAAQDLRLADLGVTAAQAQQGFSHLGQESELFHGLPGQNEQDISTDQQLGAEFMGDAAAQKTIEQRARSRVATFGGGGGFNTSREGVGGLGQAR